MASPEERSARALEGIERHLKYLGKALAELNIKLARFTQQVEEVKESDPNQLELVGLPEGMMCVTSGRHKVSECRYEPKPEFGSPDKPFGEIDMLDNSVHQEKLVYDDWTGYVKAHGPNSEKNEGNDVAE